MVKHNMQNLNGHETVIKLLFGFERGSPAFRRFLRWPLVHMWMASVHVFVGRQLYRKVFVMAVAPLFTTSVGGTRMKTKLAPNNTAEDVLCTKRGVMCPLLESQTSSSSTKMLFSDFLHSLCWCRSRAESLACNKLYHFCS